MPRDLPTVLDLPRETAVLDGPDAERARVGLHRTLGCDGTLVVALDPPLVDGDVVLPFMPLSGLAELGPSDVVRPWLRLDVLGWEERALAAVEEAGLLAIAAAVELDVAVADGIVRSPSLAWVTARLGPRFSLAMITPTHGNATTGVTWTARAVFVAGQPST